MTQMEIKSSESGITRVFHINLPPEAIERFTTQAGTGEWPLQYALGATKLRNSFVEVVNLRDLGDMPLSTYLRQGYGLTGDDLKLSARELDSLTGHVLVLPSQAFDNTAQVLTIGMPLRWVGTFEEPGRSKAKLPLSAESAKGVLEGALGQAGESTGRSRLLTLIMAGLAILIIAILALVLF